MLRLSSPLARLRLAQHDRLDRCHYSNHPALRKADAQAKKLRNSPVPKGLDQVMELLPKSTFMLPIRDASLTITKGDFLAASG